MLWRDGVWRYAAPVVTSYLMSYPPASWRIQGAANFRSQSRPPTNPHRAAHEWLALADAITAAGGRVLVLPAADTSAPLTGMMYTANAGAWLGQAFVISRMKAAHRLGEAEHVESFCRRAELPYVHLPMDVTWEGQAEIATLPGLRFILTYGVRSDAGSVLRVQERLPTGAKTLVVKIREPYFHGDVCLSVLATPSGPVLLACAEALVDCSLAELADFAEGVEVIAVSEADTLAYACNALCEGTTWLVPPGLSAPLRAKVTARGLVSVELDFAELFQKGGGGPRCLVNVMKDLGDVPDEVCFSLRRAALVAALSAYPTKA